MFIDLEIFALRCRRAICIFVWSVSRTSVSILGIAAGSGRRIRSTRSLGRIEVFRYRRGVSVSVSRCLQATLVGTTLAAHGGNLSHCGQTFADGDSLLCAVDGNHRILSGLQAGNGKGQHTGLAFHALGSTPV